MGKLTPNYADQVRERTAPVPPLKRKPRHNGTGPHAEAAAVEEAVVTAALDENPYRAELPPPSVGTVTFTAQVPSFEAPVEAKPALKVALIGTAPSSRLLAPFADPSWEIWVCSPGNMNTLPRVTRWFEIHGNLLWPENQHYGAPYIDWLKQQQFPVYMQDQSMVPNAIPFPWREMVKEFGPYPFTSSFSWMTAYAITQGATEIMLYGIDMASRDEYALQRQGYQHFFTETKRRGIKLGAPYESDIMQPPPLYGFSDVTPFGRKVLARKKEITDRVAAMENERARLNDNITYLKGALEDIAYFADLWLGVQSMEGLQ